MLNACGTSEGNNEFVLFTTAVSAAANTYIVNYGTANPPVTNRMSGVDIKAKTGTGVISASGGCVINFITIPTDVIPAGAKVIFIPANTDNNYDITGLCTSGSIYVAYINTVAPITGTTSWSATGVLANSATTSRFLQVTSATAGCNAAGAPAVSYLGSSFVPNIDGNMVTWNAGVPSYSNNGCNNVILDLEELNITVNALKNYNLLKWDIGNETNIKNFKIEKSNDGVIFSEIGNLNPTSLNGMYSFNDYDLSKNICYYRIIVTHNNDRILVSNIVKINSKIRSENELSCYPSVAKDIIYLQWFSETKSNTSISIIDAYGKVVLNKNFAINIGFNRNSMDINQLAVGSYFVRVISGNTKMTERFVKQ